MSFTVIIPARYDSSRLPGKPLADIAGKPMIQHVWEKAVSSTADEVIIATDHVKVAEAADAFGATVVMTSTSHMSGTDRLQEVCKQKQYNDDHIIINLQGDEPLFPAKQIDLLYEQISSRPQAGIATLCCSVESWEQLMNPNVVKVARRLDNYALYFSRAPIPWVRENDFNLKVEDSGLMHSSLIPNAKNPIAAFRHLGIYAYRVKVLNDFVRWPQSGLEQKECLEQLRALDNGVNIYCELAAYDIPEGIDTEQDLQRVRSLLSKS